MVGAPGRAGVAASDRLRPVSDLGPPRPWTAEFAAGGCEHYQAPGNCWMCREGEHFTGDGQQALTLLSVLKEGRDEHEQFLLSYAQGAVVSDQWKQFSHRMSAAANASGNLRRPL